MSDVPMPRKGFLTVSEMCELCQLSRSRWYDLVAAGVFPKPVRHPSSKRPMYDPSLQEMCLEIRKTGIGANGLPVLFNRKPKRSGPAKVQRQPAVESQPDHADLLVALKELGLSTTAQAVNDAVAALYPTGIAGLDQGDLIRKVFLHLQGKRR
jgi:hypothetical protein